MSTSNTSDKNKIIYLPEDFADIVRVPGRGIILKRTMKHARSVSKHGIIMPEVSGGKSFEKKYDLGEVIAVGPDAITVKKGDVLIYAHETAFRIPDGDQPGNDNPRFVRIDETSAHIIAILPGDVPEGE